MFIGRSTELRQLKDALASDRRTAVLVYGKRRIGKSTLIQEAAGDFPGTVINYLCVRSSFAGNMELFSRSIADALGLPAGLRFSTLMDAFAFLGKQSRPVLVILDEYQYLKSSGKTYEVDSYMQAVIDRLPASVKIVLCGSYISVMKELMEEDDPLFGRFSLILHLTEMDYLTASRFYEEAGIRRKIENYAVFGGSPYVLSMIDPAAPVKENVCRLLLPSTGILRTYIENTMLAEIQKAYDVRILECIGNGRKKYSEISSALGGDRGGLLDKQLKNLLSMETIGIEYPINKPEDNKKKFYVISDNLMRFYFTYIFGKTGRLLRLGETVFWKNEIEPSIAKFVSRRFEGLVREFFSMRVRSGAMKGINDIGMFWYDDPERRTSGEFDCVLKRKDCYDFYACKYYRKPMTEAQCRDEAEQVSRIADKIPVGRIGFVCSAGFSFDSDQYDLISGEEMYSPAETFT